MCNNLNVPVENVEFMGEIMDEEIDRDSLANSDEAKAHFMAYEDVWDGEKMVTHEEMDAQLHTEEK